MAPLPVVSAKGAYLHLEDGRKILDGISSWWCNLHGHSHHEIVSAISKQAGTLDHVLFGGCTHPPAVELAEKIQLGLGIKCGKVFYSDNGSTAVEVALKIALQRWKNRGDTRIKIFALENAYHGDTFGAMAVGARGVYSLLSASRYTEMNEHSTGISVPARAELLQLLFLSPLYKVLEVLLCILNRYWRNTLKSLVNTAS
jgi:adenosylmethionine-8-amino-7-oxononanoate aminotransferase